MSSYVKVHQYFLYHIRYIMTNELLLLIAFVEKCHLNFLSQNSLGCKPINFSFQQEKSISLKLQKSPEDKNNIISFRPISNWLASKFNRGE